MALQCNIDQRGRTFRVVTGAIIDGIGTALIVAGFMKGNWYLLAGGIALSLAGTFAIFEGAAGWCALRAMGIKTRL